MACNISEYIIFDILMTFMSFLQILWNVENCEVMTSSTLSFEYS